MSEFDAKASTWDANSMHVERAEAIAAAVKELIDLNDIFNALEYGAGTGLLSFALKDHIKEITLMDSSEEMIRVIAEKITRAGITNMHPLFFDLEKNSFKDGKFNLIYSSMVMHHIPDLKKVLSEFNNLLTDGGTLAIADLYMEDGSFHDSSFNGHKGFDVNELEKLLRSIGFRSIKHKPCYTIKKVTETGETREYPIFLLVAEKD